MPGLNLSFKRDVQTHESDSVCYIWSRREYYRENYVHISTEGTASQEISKLQQHKYRLDGRKNLLIVRAVSCRECVSKAGYETSITTDFKKRRNSVQRMLKRLAARGHMKSALLLSPPGGAWTQWPWSLPWPFNFHTSPSPTYVTVNLLLTSTFVLLSFFYKTCEV